ncbi:helix-turn-helix domain-containing protein [Bacteroidota bacterium]
MKKDQEVLLNFGQKIRKLRKDQDISQEELADKAGLHRTYIGMIERAEKNITLVNIEKLALALDVEIQQFFE